ncbi:hypothetical protein [Streptomyces sp. 8L]|uniref:hypothetical protein n=1 Tax=Streptomyces sp. 8L TaxID=2877242 RepID=UPI001CD74FB8|nr:hypothetical protein [Streptomyces sp. 8L]MCA1218475.1 hypothetical protein [Streptomyces sp. 8L]
MVSHPAGPVGPRATTDLGHGGRWTSLVAHGRDWLWHRTEPARAGAAPGTPFADAGGLEECVPTVRGTPDHGDAWSRPWQGDGARAWVQCPGFRLERRIRTHAAETVVDYTLSAPAGYRFVWAAHALLDLSEQARVGMARGTPLRLYPDEGPAWSTGRWPTAGGVRLDEAGPADGTALGAVVETPETTVYDGPDTLTLRVEADGAPVAIALWRNLGGFPRQAPYRSVGVEPMLGRVFDSAGAADGDTACGPATGELRWRLTLTSSRHTDGASP